LVLIVSFNPIEVSVLNRIERSPLEEQFLVTALNC